jgi:hypothetical protein
VGVAGATIGGLALFTGRWWLSGVAVALALLARGCQPLPDPDRWRRGAGGEVATAALLAGLPRRFVVFHDRRLPGGRGNIDHLVFGPSGVWVVDSKSRRARLRVRHGQVRAGQYPIDVTPVRTQAARVADRLGVPVTPLVAVHGPGLRRRGKRVEGVLVLPAGRVIRRLRRGRHLRSSEVAPLAEAADQMFPPCQGG